MKHSNDEEEVKGKGLDMNLIDAFCAGNKPCYDMRTADQVFYYPELREFFSAWSIMKDDMLGVYIAELQEQGFKVLTDAEGRPCIPVKWCGDGA